MDEKVKKREKKKKNLSLHDQSVHLLVSELCKHDDEKVMKPQLQEKKFRKKKLDLGSLMDKELKIDQNIYNLTIG